jgi:hypothetical protein
VVTGALLATHIRFGPVAAKSRRTRSLPGAVSSPRDGGWRRPARAARVDRASHFFRAAAAHQGWCNSTQPV